MFSCMAIVYMFKSLHARTGSVNDIALNIRRGEQLADLKAVVLEQLFKLRAGKCRLHSFSASFRHHYRILHALLGGGKEVFIGIVENKRAAGRA